MRIEPTGIPLGSAGCQPAAFGSLPNAAARSSRKMIQKCSWQAAANYRLVPQARDAPQK